MRLLLLAVALVLLAMACAGRPGVREAVGVAAAGQPAAAELPSAAEQPPADSLQATEPGAASQFVVTEEVYSKTFEEVEAFIRTLNDIIRREDYETWLDCLSEPYIARTSDPIYLKEQSDTPVLRSNNIQLYTLKDYFFHVVVPSRVQAALEEIEFIDQDHVKAITTFRSTRALLYLLEREDGRWKIGLW
jgi:hypothetical protein